MEAMGTKMGKLTLDKPMEWFNWHECIEPGVRIGLVLLTAVMLLGV